VAEPQPPPAQYSPDGRWYWDGRQWIPTAPAPGQTLVAWFQQQLVRRLEFELEVGEVELHRVHFLFDQFWGPVRISVDGKRVVRDFRLFTLSTTKRYRFTVGEQEPHDVVIEQIRSLVAAGFRSQVARVFVDGRLAGEYTS
jgi:hypothetical protein